MGAASLIVILVPLIVMVAIMGLLVVSLMEEVCPDELLILCGGGRKIPDGGVSLGEIPVGEWLPATDRNFDIVTGGRVVTMPLIERVERMDIKPFELRLEVSDVRTRDGVRVSVSGSATVAVDMTPKQAEQFVKLFLGRPRDEIIGAVRKTLESHIRDVVSMLDVEELDERSDEVAERLAETVVYDLELLGLELEALSFDDR